MSIAFKIENMEQEAQVLKSIALATYDAIYNGCTGYEAFEGALYSVFNMAHDHAEHMKALTTEAYALQRSGKECADN